MKILLLYDYPPSPGGLATQGDLMYRGLKELGVDVYPVNFEAPQEKEWYYRWFEPDVVLGVGYWGHTPDLVLHPQRYGVQPVPWLVADGYMANYQEVLDSLPLILVTSNWVKKVYVRDGLKGENIDVLPVGCDTESFVPREMTDAKVMAVRESLGIPPEQLMILTVGGDAASKGAQEVMQALSLIDKDAPDWKYVLKVWPQARTDTQNLHDMELATHLGIDKNVMFATGRFSRNFMPYLLAACDIYAAPSRLEGFGMPQVEAGACGKPVIGIKAMAMLDTLVHGKTAFLASVAQEVKLRETILGGDEGYQNQQRVVFKRARTVDYRASVHDIATHLKKLMNDADLRKRMGQAGRKRVVEHYDYRVVAKKLVDILHERLGLDSMGAEGLKHVEEAKRAALEVLLANAHGPFKGLPRAAGWGYPEPYTRDLMITGLGILTTGNKELVRSLRRVLETLAENQTKRGHIPSLVHDREDRGASDTTPLFLLTTAAYRMATGQKRFLREPVKRALEWMDYQSPSDRVLVGQLPTSDWRDEQWVLGFGLYVNSVVYGYLRLHGEKKKALQLREVMERFTITGEETHRHVHEGLAVRRKPYYALWSYKVMSSERFDLLGNSMAILVGLCSRRRAGAVANWVERECKALREKGDLAVDLPPNFFPYIHREDPDWKPRYEKFNRPGEYHNGGIWPFVCGFYVGALVAAGKMELARKKLGALTELVRPAREAEVEFGFNEWIKAQDGTPRGQDWQTWSAGMYLYATACVEEGRTPFFDAARRGLRS